MLTVTRHPVRAVAEGPLGYADGTLTFEEVTWQKQ